MAFPKIDGYVVTQKIGSGSYSTVYKAMAKVGARSIVAIKCIEKSKIKNSGSAIENMLTEIKLLKTLSHPHIVQMKDFTWDDRNIYIIMEYCCGGDLSKYIHKCGRIPEKKVLYFLQQLAVAMKFLWNKGIVHMDLKPHNLLLHRGSDSKYVLKLADFGFAVTFGTNVSSVRGSPLYMAPEMIAGRCDARVDLWSVGVIMYECLFGKAPYSSNTLKELFDKIERQAPILIPKNASISDGCRDLLTRLLKHDPNERISYEEFFAHEYLDLEHMPSKENYDKAVRLIKSAVDFDVSGNEMQAFEAYRDGLLYLVPVYYSEADEMRRAALRAKITMYTDRAEQLKEKLQRKYKLNDDSQNTQKTEASNYDVSQSGVPATVPYSSVSPEYSSNTQDGESTSKDNKQGVQGPSQKVDAPSNKLSLRRLMSWRSDSNATNGENENQAENNDTCRIS